MEFFSPNKLNIDFSKYFRFFGVLSWILCAAGLISIFTPGFNFGIDFRGGIEAHVQFKSETSVTDLRKALESKLKNLSVVQFDETTTGLAEFSITAQSDEKESVSKILSESLTAQFGPSSETSWTVKKMDVVGPKVGDSLKKSAILSLVFTCLLISIYLYWRFDLRFSPGAVFTIFHDLLVASLFIVCAGLEFSSTTVAALLTLAGYSINDTVVVYDRIRELETQFTGKLKKDIVNMAIASTLSRTVMTAGTTLVSCIVLYFVGGEGIRDFALILFVGIVVGTYSSIYIAAPFYLWADKKFSEIPDSAPTTKPAKART
jgi:preprotein translocase subunit SecF